MTHEEIERLVEFEGKIFVANGEVILPNDKIETMDIINQYLAAGGEIVKQATSEEALLVQDKIAKHRALDALTVWRAAGRNILDEVAILLAQKAPTPSEGLANLAALEIVDKLLNRGDLRVAKAALEAADLSGTSFDGDTDSYDYIIGLLDQKIAELTP